MKKHLLLSFLFLYFFSLSLAQSTFQKTYGGAGTDYAYCVEQTNDGGFILAGYTTSFGAGNEDVYVIKTGYSGDTLWTKTFGGSGEDRSNSVQQTSDGGFIIAGTTTSFGAGLSDVYLIKTNASGGTLWSKTYGGTLVDKGNYVQQTTDGGYIITGYTFSFGSMNSYGDLYLIKTDAGGDTLWTKTIGGSGGGYAGNALEQTTDGGYIIAGDAYIGWYTDIYLVKTNSTGDTLWTNRFNGTTAATPYDDAYSVKQTFDGGYIITGASGSAAASNEALLLKTDTNGNLVWANVYGTPTPEFAYCVQQTSDSGYIFCGNQGAYDLYVIKTNDIGDTLWTKLYGGLNQEYGYSIQQTNDDGYIIGGVTNSTGAGNWDVYLIKTDASGNSGCNETIPLTIVSAAPLAVVSFSPTFSSGCTVAAAATAVGSGGIVNTQCLFCNLTVSFSGLPDTVCINGTTSTLTGNPVGGIFTGSGMTNNIFDPASAGAGLHDIIYSFSASPSCFDSDTFSVFVDICASIDGLYEHSALKISPNPFTTEFVLTGTAAKGELILFDILGNEILRQQTISSETKINTEKLLPGVYLLRFNSENRTLIKF